MKTQNTKLSSPTPSHRKGSNEVHFFNKHFFQFLVVFLVILILSLALFHVVPLFLQGT